ncbi:MAG: efflux RND transporter permease subunit, partial [Elusimicrobia bacterium]|nr:efflux RND transporter permease subunit [Elusimicrobiota bacterium]
REREIHVVVNPNALKAYNLSIYKVRAALQQQNVEVPGGRVDQGRRELVLRTLGRVGSPREFEAVVLAHSGGVPVRLRDVARVADTEEEPRTLARLDGQPSVSLIVQKQSGTNTVAVIRTVKERLEELRAGLPPGVRVEVVNDQSQFIIDSVNTVTEHLVLGAILASLAVLLFMGDIRSTLIASVAIPTSIIATFILMRAVGFTLNNMTLLALALAVGIVIDDAIVVLENVFRHMEERKISAMRAASEGTGEIALAVMATTLSLVIIFLPLAYMYGIVGRFLRSYGLTVAFAILVSLFVAFTLTPMLCSRFLKLQEGERHALQRWVDRFNDWLKGHYGRLVAWSLAHRGMVVGISAGIILSTFVIGRFLGSDFLPPDDTGEFNVAIKAPEGTALPMTDEILKQVEADLRRLPGVKSLLVSIAGEEGLGVNDGIVYVRLVDYGERKHDQFEIMAMARRALAKYTGLRTSVVPAGGFKSSGEKDFNYILSGPDLVQLRSYADHVVQELKKVKGLVDVDTSLTYKKPELQVRINRDRAQDLGVRVQDIAVALRTMVSGEEDITKYKEADNLYPVKVRVDKTHRDNAEAIGGLTLPSARGGLVRLDNVAALVEEEGPSQIERFNRQRQIAVQANLEGATLGDALGAADRIVKEMKLPPEYQAVTEGKAKEMGRMMKGFLMAFVLSFIFMYMILASQFESFLHPVTIMLSLPLSIPFALLSLVVTGQALTIFSIMGVFMLFGIVKKNAILQVDYTNTLRERGLPRDEAILEANKTRLRPILMTTLVLVAAMVPVALGRGPGSANRATMAVVIIGGQTLSLVITLLITPVAYSLFDDATAWASARWGRKARPAELPARKVSVE